MVARKRTRKQLYSGGSNNNNTNKKELLESIKSLLVQLKDTDDHHIQALRAALLFIRSAIEIKTKKASSNNKSLLTKASSATNMIGNSLLLNNQDDEFKSKLKEQINSMSGMEKSALVSDLFGTLKANDINQDTIRNLFIDKDRDGKFQLLAKLLILSGKSASIQMGGANLMNDLGKKLNTRRTRMGPSNSNNTSSETMPFGSSDTQTPATTSLTGTSVNAKFEKETREARQQDINAVTEKGFVGRMGDGLGLKLRTSPPTMPTSTKTSSTDTSTATFTATSKATSKAKATANAVVPDLSQSNESSNNSNRSTDTQVVPETETSSSMTSSSTQPQSSSKPKSSSNNNVDKIQQKIEQLLTIDFLKSLMNDMSSSVVGGGSRKKNRSKKHKRRSSNKNKYSNKKKSSNKK